MKSLLLIALGLLAFFMSTASAQEMSDYDVGIDVLNCYIEQEEFPKAENLLGTMLKERQKDRLLLDNETIIDAIQCYIRTGETEKAEEVLKMASVGHPVGEEFIPLTYDSGIEAVRNVIRWNRFGDAEAILGRMLKEYPDNLELLGILAKVLFWQKRYDESIAVYERMLSLKSDESVRRELEAVMTARAIQESEALVERGEIDQAERILKSLYDAGKNDYDSGYRLGMLYIKKREYGKATDIFQALETRFPDDRGFTALYIESLILDGDIARARDTLYGLPEATKDSLYQEREDLFYRVRRNYIKASGSIFARTGNQKNETDESLEISQRIKELTFVLNAAHVYRFGLHDSQITLDAYSKLGEKTKRWGYVSLAVSPDAEFLPKTSVAAEVYQGYKEFEFSFGYRRMAFRDATVDILFPGLILYLPYGLSLNEKFYYVPKNDSYSLLSTLNYEPSHRFRGFYSITLGKTAEQIGSLVDLVKRNTLSTRLGAEYRFKPAYSLGGELSYEYRQSLYNTYGFSFYTRHWW